MFGLVGVGYCVDAADFYVSPSGKDSHSGTSPKAPWKTLQRVNRHIADHRLAPGDGLFLEGGATFDGGFASNMPVAERGNHRFESPATDAGKRPFAQARNPAFSSERLLGSRFHN